MLLLLSTLAASPLGAQPASPGGRSLGAMVYDAARREVVLFGGYAKAPSGDGLVYPNGRIRLCIPGIIAPAARGKNDAAEGAGSRFASRAGARNEPGFEMGTAFYEGWFVKPAGVGTRQRSWSRPSAATLVRFASAFVPISCGAASARAGVPTLWLSVHGPVASAAGHCLLSVPGTAAMESGSPYPSCASRASSHGGGPPLRIGLGLCDPLPEPRPFHGRTPLSVTSTSRYCHFATPATSRHLLLRDTCYFAVLLLRGAATSQSCYFAVLLPRDR